MFLFSQIFLDMYAAAVLSPGATKPLVPQASLRGSLTLGWLF